MHYEEQATKRTNQALTFFSSSWMWAPTNIIPKTKKQKKKKKKTYN